MFTVSDAKQVHALGGGTHHIRRVAVETHLKENQRHHYQTGQPCRPYHRLIRCVRPLMPTSEDAYMLTRILETGYVWRLKIILPSV